MTLIAAITGTRQRVRFYCLPTILAEILIETAMLSSDKRKEQTS